MDIQEYTRRFNLSYQYLVRTHNFFFVWRALQKKEYEKYWRGTDNFWSAVNIALQDSWMLSLARIYENSDYSDKDEIISLFSLVNHQKDSKRKEILENILKQKQGVIKNISIIRHHVLAHNNAEHKITREKLFEKFPIKYKEIEEIFDLTEDIFHMLHPDSHHSLSMEGFHERCKQDTMEVMNAMRLWKEEKQRKIDKSIREFDESLKRNKFVGS